MEVAPGKLVLNIIKPEFIINSEGALAVLLPKWLTQDVAESLYRRSILEIPWICGQTNMFGKIINIPREMFFLGDEHVKTYSYSRNSFPVIPWVMNPLYEEIRHIRDSIRQDCTINGILSSNYPTYPGDLSFNSCLLNLYRTGEHKIDYHSDKEALGPMNAVITVSLGCTRTFVFKNKCKADNGKYPTIKLNLHNGDLLLMAGNCQNLWTHGIPREPCDGSRISLTYRLI